MDDIENLEENVQLSTVSAVLVQDAVKSYGLGKHRNLVLDKLNMTVPKNKIYGLLGPSGCGKTTLLSAMVGLQQLSSGNIQIFGNNGEVTLVGYYDKVDKYPSSNNQGLSEESWWE